MSCLRFSIFSSISLCLLCTQSLVACQAPPEQKRASAIEALSEQTGNQGFARALQPRPFVFPQDAGPHPDFQTEWWYYTGHLQTPQGRQFGYQLTFFRRGIKPGFPDSKDNAWATHQVYFAHLALSDLQNQRFYAQERWSRGSLGLAGAEASPYHVWLQDWQLQANAQGVALQAKGEDFNLNLQLKSLKPVVLHGKQGLSQKSPQAGNASYYYSQTRIDSRGSISIGNQTVQVSGLSWLDREWSTSVLSQEQIGWDWFSLQFNDGRELMLYQLRNRDGSRDPISSGTLVDTKGQTTALQASDFKIETRGNWQSPKTQVKYPSGWHVSLPQYDLELDLVPQQKDQELRLSFAYWEGAVSVKGLSKNNKAITGLGYVELTGYTSDKP
jgi:predicted secreted hydrolase